MFDKIQPQRLTIPVVVPGEAALTTDNDVSNNLTSDEIDYQSDWDGDI